MLSFQSWVCCPVLVFVRYYYFIWRLVLCVFSFRVWTFPFRVLRPSALVLSASVCFLLARLSSSGHGPVMLLQGTHTHTYPLLNSPLDSQECVCCCSHAFQTGGRDPLWKQGGGLSRSLWTVVALWRYSIQILRPHRCCFYHFQMCCSQNVHISVLLCVSVYLLRSVCQSWESGGSAHAFNQVIFGFARRPNTAPLFLSFFLSASLLPSPALHLKHFLSLCSLAPHCGRAAAKTTHRLFIQHISYLTCRVTFSDE